MSSRRDNIRWWTWRVATSAPRCVSLAIVAAGKRRRSNSPFPVGGAADGALLQPIVFLSWCAETLEVQRVIRRLFVLVSGGFLLSDKGDRIVTALGAQCEEERVANLVVDLM
jgi:hypothetical protein